MSSKNINNIGSTRNTTTDYGSVAKFFHWSIFLLVVVQLYTAYQSKILPEGSPVIGFLIGRIHKPTGMLILMFTLLAYSWRKINIKPEFPSLMPLWEKLAANFTHILLYLCLIVMPTSGLLLSVSAGYPPNFFGLFQVPQFIEKNKAVSDSFFEVHQYTSYLLIALVILHIAAAFKHHFYDKDNVLKRMLPFAE